MSQVTSHQAPRAAQTMSSREIAELASKQHKHVMADIRSMCDQLGIDSAEFSAQYQDSTGRTLPCFDLDRYHTEVLITGYDVKRRAAVIKRWYDLETGQATPAPQPDQARLTGELALLECFCTLNNPAPSSRVVLLEKIGSAHGLNTDWLPGYVEDGPEAGAGRGSLPTASATDLLCEYGVPLTAAAFNRQLHAIGILEQRTRRSRSGPKQFWCITGAGEPFGKNLTSPQSPRETQPHWYRDRFVELLAMIGMRGVA